MVFKECIDEIDMHEEQTECLEGMWHVRKSVPRWPFKSRFLRGALQKAYFNAASTPKNMLHLFM